MEKKETKLIGQATPEQIEAWKLQFGTVKEVEIDGHVCYLRLPDRKILGMASALGSDPIKFNELLLANCWLGGSEAIKTNDELFFGVSQVLGELVTFKTAKIKNL